MRRYSLREVHPLMTPYDRGEGRFVRVKVWSNDYRRGIAEAKSVVTKMGWTVLDVVSCVQQPFDVAAIGRGEPSGGSIVEVRIA